MPGSGLSVSSYESSAAISLTALARGRLPGGVKISALDPLMAQVAVLEAVAAAVVVAA